MPYKLDFLQRPLNACNWDCSQIPALHLQKHARPEIVKTVSRAWFPVALDKTNWHWHNSTLSSNIFIYIQQPLCITTWCWYTIYREVLILNRWIGIWDFSATLDVTSIWNSFYPSISLLLGHVSHKRILLLYNLQLCCLLELLGSLFVMIIFRLLQ